jgi:hypothetical protein
MVAEYASETSAKSPTTTWYNNTGTELTSVKSVIRLSINEK